MKQTSNDDSKLIFPVGSVSGEDDPFVYDDALRQLAHTTSRKALITAFGGSGLSRWDYERRNGFPFGTIDLALMAEDKILIERSGALHRKINDAMDDVDMLAAVFKEYASFLRGQLMLYPQGVQLLNRLAALSSNAKQYSGQVSPAFWSGGGLFSHSPAPKFEVNYRSAVNVWIYLNAILATHAVIALDFGALVSVAWIASIVLT